MAASDKLLSIITRWAARLDGRNTHLSPFKPHPRGSDNNPPPPPHPTTQYLDVCYKLSYRTKILRLPIKFCLTRELQFCCYYTLYLPSASWNKVSCYFHWYRPVNHKVLSLVEYNTFLLLRAYIVRRRRKL